MLKPAFDAQAACWVGDLFSTLSGPGFRVPRPVRAQSGGWLFDGWVAWRPISGEPGVVQHWSQVVATGHAFHAALTGVQPPGWLGREDNPWAIAERVAWGEQTITVVPALRGQVDALAAVLRPIDLPAQLIHGDFAGNVLFSDGEPPAVIDFSPDFRPAGYALAIAAVDALTWSGASTSILDELAGEPEIDQLLARALIYRLVTESQLRRDPGSLVAVATANRPVVDLVLARIAGSPAPSAYLSDGRLAELAAPSLGERHLELKPLRPGGGGHTRAIRRLAQLTNGARVFIKAPGPGATEQLTAEVAAYTGLAPAPFLPAVVAALREPIPLLILEALPDDGWVTEWTPQVIADTQDLLDKVHATPAPTGLRRLKDPAAGGENPWDAIAQDPQRLLRLHLCEPAWLNTHLPALRVAAVRAPLAGTDLIHLDVHGANLCYRDGQLVLVDWAAAAAGNRWFDHHGWLVTMHAEGGPSPEHRQGPDAAAHAAWIAGQQPLLTPARDSDPALFDLRRRRLAAALPWAARLLGLPQPVPPCGAPPL